MMKKYLYALLWVGIVVAEESDCMITPPWVLCRNDYGFLTEGSFLYWKAEEDNLEVAQKFILPEGGSIQSRPVAETTLEIPTQWDPGFRVKLSGLLPYDGWQVAAQWTWFRTHSNIPMQSGFFLPEFFFSADIIPVGAVNVSADWALKLNDLELLFSRSFFLSESLLLSPFFGVRNAWIDQHMKVEYLHVFAIINQTPPPVDAADSTARATNNFWGIGPTFGSQAQWLWKYGLFADFGIEFSFLSGRLNAECHSSILDKTVPELIPLKLSATFHRVRPVLGGNLGLGWETCFCTDVCRDYFLRLSADYEVQMWWDQMQLNLFNEVNYDLSFQGLTLRALFGF